MKIAIGQISHETNTFSSVPTTKSLFELWEWDYGDDIVARHKGVEDYVGGMIDRACELGIEVVPTFSAFANPSGTITRETYELLKQALIDGLQGAGEVDAICLALHGAGVAEGFDDLEGDLLQAVREFVGRDMPIVVTLDLHANVTERMVAYADVLLGVNFYPHTDSYDRGREAIDVAKQMVDGNLRPVMNLVRLPLMIPTSTTNLSPAKDVNEVCWGWEKRPDVVDCTLFHGFPHTDTPDVCVSVLTVTNDDSHLAQEASEDVANFVWQTREAFFPHTASPSEGIHLALQAEGRPIVINETSDNPGGGTPGDGTHLLRAMINEELTSACFGTIYDPEVARIAHESGVGTWIDVQLGGKTDSLHGEPLQIHAYVKTLSDGQFLQSSPMWRGKQVDLGKSARLVVGGIDVIVCSVCSQVFDEQIFLLHGIDVSEYKIVALKSSQHFRAAYESIAAEIITVDSPGLSSRQLSSFQYERITRPIYPLDDVTRRV
ncbi:M81 family metallopeptidase [Alicyclobacillus dauci]|uniref:M81 family metallopeptidase n=1 Tax=Alicyclobacillus dauci TaxID=1475485 RepID=A0ABY6Z659_9BACL|nr:M81 family metallopeptidase [Alicyclobacillus dauci]WAH37998.1 M81 family metallopeptidase [Alicyclobacillus dauci]